MVAARRPYTGLLPIVLALLLVAVVAVGGLAYALFGQSFGTTYTRFHSTSAAAGETRGTIRIDGAPERITITARDIGAQLYEANVDYVGSAPRLSYEDGNVWISKDSNVVSSWGRSRDIVELSVNPSVAWTIEIDTAGTTTRLDLSSAKLRSFKLDGAGSTVKLTAGQPQGVVSVSISGVGNSLAVSLPGSAEYRVTADGIATNVGGTPETQGWSTAQDRYDVSLNGVGSSATVTASD
jgi:hypothetical protein